MFSVSMWWKKLLTKMKSNFRFDRVRTCATSVAMNSASVAPAGVRDVVLVPVEPEVLRAREETRIDARAAAHVENAARRSELVVATEGDELLLRVGGLPEAVDRDVLHHRGEHG